MRENEFRVWDKENCVMITEGGYIQVDGYGQSSIYDDINMEWVENNERMILMRFSGKQDMHDKDIYAGDILKGIMKAGAGNQNKKGKECLFEVKIINDGWGYRFILSLITKLVGDYRCFPDFEETERVGNIHENPELFNEGVS